MIGTLRDNLAVHKHMFAYMGVWAIAQIANRQLDRLRIRGR